MKIIEGLCELDNFNASHIDTISQLFNNETWFVTFKDSFKATELFGKEIVIGGKTITMYDPNETNPTVKYKVSWVPHGITIDKDLIEVYKSFNMKITGINCEYMKDCVTIKTGNLIISAIKENEEKNQYVESGIYDFGEFDIFIRKFGDVNRCFACGKTGHYARNCDNKSKVNGPKSYSSMLKEVVEINLPDDHELDEEMEQQQGQVNNNEHNKQVINDNFISDCESDLNEFNKLETSDNLTISSIANEIKNNIMNSNNTKTVEQQSSSTTTKRQQPEEDDSPVRNEIKKANIAEEKAANREETGGKNALSNSKKTQAPATTATNKNENKTSRVTGNSGASNQIFK